MPTVPPVTDTQSDDLPTGAVVGIVIGSLVGIFAVALLAVGAYTWLVASS